MATDAPGARRPPGLAGCREERDDLAGEAVEGVVNDGDLDAGAVVAAVVSHPQAAALEQETQVLVGGV